MEIAAIVYFTIAIVLTVYMLYNSPIKIRSREFLVVLGVCFIWPLTILAFLLDPE